jgi:hypothetical protein
MEDWEGDQECTSGDTKEKPRQVVILPGWTILGNPQKE